MTEEQPPTDIKEEFATKTGGDNRAKILKLYEDLKEANVTHTNFNKYFESMQTSNTIIDSQIENIYTNYIPERDEHNGMLSLERVQSGVERGIVPLELYQALKKLSSMLKEMVSWKMLQNEMLSLLIEKFYIALREAKAFEIKRDALKEMREMETKRNDLLLEVVKKENENTAKIISLAFQEYRLDTKENINLMTNAIKEVMKIQASIIHEFKSVADFAGSAAEVRRVLDDIDKQKNSKEDRLDTMDPWSFDEPPLPPPALEAEPGPTKIEAATARPTDDDMLNMMESATPEPTKEEEDVAPAEDKEKKTQKGGGDTDDHSEVLADV